MAILVVTNTLYFCLSGKDLITFILKKTFEDMIFLIDSCFLSVLINISFHGLSSERFLLRKPLIQDYDKSPLKILSLTFNSWTVMFLGVDFFTFNLFGVLWASSVWISIYLQRFEKISVVISLSSLPLSLSSPSQTPIISILVHLRMSHKSHRLFFFTLFHSFFPFNQISNDLT